MTEDKYQETGLTKLEVLEEYTSSYSSDELFEGQRIHDLTGLS